jgi:hypothetical protein
MLRSHLDAILAWTKTRLSNGAAEGMNNRIKSINHGSFGYRSAVAAIYLCCASLPLPIEHFSDRSPKEIGRLAIFVSCVHPCSLSHVFLIQYPP